MLLSFHEICCFIVLNIIGVFVYNIFCVYPLKTPGYAVLVSFLLVFFTYYLEMDMNNAFLSKAIINYCAISFLYLF